MMIRFHLSPKFCALRLLHCVHHLKFQNQETAINIVIQMESNISFCVSDNKVEELENLLKDTL
jgi:hypothetical protein